MMYCNIFNPFSIQDCASICRNNGSTIIITLCTSAPTSQTSLCLVFDEEKIQWFLKHASLQSSAFCSFAWLFAIKLGFLLPWNTLGRKTNLRSKNKPTAWYCSWSEIDLSNSLSQNKIICAVHFFQMWKMQIQCIIAKSVIWSSCQSLLHERPLTSRYQGIHFGCELFNPLLIIHRNIL